MSAPEFWNFMPLSSFHVQISFRSWKTSTLLTDWPHLLFKYFELIPELPKNDI